ncbi:hypothetical protein UFOVP60_40 [uncultured Caudovirales phage]|uniref:Uncharacterized protein n=1 Tax=uncultured Caudovirales phage TaxID=2100421 RepID=A0A6J5TB27_9CAUD|nr:hypothetical protein UFOVP60_40 [uncultured Caudovirales phage]
MIPDQSKQSRIPAIDILEQVVGETILITARCGSQHVVSRYVPGIQVTQAKANVILETKLILITELALRIMKDTE